MADLVWCEETPPGVLPEGAGRPTSPLISDPTTKGKRAPFPPEPCSIARRTQNPDTLTKQNRVPHSYGCEDRVHETQVFIRFAFLCTAVCMHACPAGLACGGGTARVATLRPVRLACTRRCAVGCPTALYTLLLLAWSLHMLAPRLTGFHCQILSRS